MKKTEKTQAGGDDLREENERLRAENRRLKALLKSFAIRPASSLPSPLPERKDKETLRPQGQPARPLGPSRSGARVAEGTAPLVETPDRLSARKEKVDLFRSLFRGREDVYAVRWENRKGGSGYSPACANEWNRPLCQKPCSRCQNAKYIPISDETIRDHILGKHTIGVYPLLRDETCWFLAADFDKDGWQEDARAFLRACRDLDVAAALERSRSGRGGHVWIFFEEAIPASAARKLGSAILTRAMDGRHAIGLDSYDRFFPNQDTMPKGGFGNLIALPLQGGPWKQSNNSIFLDESFSPYPNQWQHLAALPRVSRSHVDQIVADASRRGQVIGVRLSATDDTEDQDPWTLPPSRRRAEKPLQGPLPKTVKAVRGNLLYVEKEGLSPHLMNRIVRLAAFQNPEFYSAQMMRLSTFGKPRVIGCAEEFPKHIALPRGCLDDLECFLASHGIGLAVQDERYAGTPSEFQFQGILHAEQEAAIREMLRSDNGVLVAPTGFGKTVLAARLIAERKANTLILAHRKSLLDQWRERLAMFLGMPIGEIGSFSGEKKKLGGRVDVALLQSLCRKGEVNDIVANYGHVIVDECHHIPAFTFEQVVKQAKAKYLLGLTATPIRKDGHHPIIVMQCGPIRVRIRPQDASQQQFRHVVVVQKTEFGLAAAAGEQPIQTVYAALANDMLRNQMILNDKHACTAFITAAKSDGKEGRPLCMRTVDGGATWRFISWIGPEPKGFAIMPSSVRLSATHLVTAVRCQDETQKRISVYASDDNGKTWTYLNDPVPNTGEGNPPSLILLKDGRLCLTYGYRAQPFSICARLSADNGRTWGIETVLRNDGAGRDIGYPRSVQRPDGKVVTVYYFHDSKTGPERYIAATIWDPARADDAN